MVGVKLASSAFRTPQYGSPRVQSESKSLRKKIPAGWVLPTGVFWLPGWLTHVPRESTLPGDRTERVLSTVTPFSKAVTSENALAIDPIWKPVPPPKRRSTLQFSDVSLIWSFDSSKL